jgi:hypothetical protein
MDFLGLGKRHRTGETAPPSPEGPPPVEGSFEEKVLSYIARAEKQNAEFAGFRQEVSDNFKGQAENLTKAFEALTAEYAAVKQENIVLKTRLLALETRQEITEIQAKSSNLILYNIAETAPADTEANVKSLLGGAAAASWRPAGWAPLSPGPQSHEECSSSLQHHQANTRRTSKAGTSGNRASSSMMILPRNNNKSVSDSGGNSPS